jgi:hypothetical protein
VQQQQPEENAPKRATIPAAAPAYIEPEASRSWWGVIKELAKYISWKDAILLCAAAGMLVAAALAGVAIPVLVGKLQLAVSGAKSKCCGCT